MRQARVSRVPVGEIHTEIHRDHHPNHMPRFLPLHHPQLVPQQHQQQILILNLKVGEQRDSVAQVEEAQAVAGVAVEEDQK